MRENIFRSNDPKQTILTIEDAAALQAGDVLVWIDDLGQRWEGPIPAGYVPSIAFYDDEDSKTFGAVFYSIDGEDGELVEFVEEYPLGSARIAGPEIARIQALYEASH